jgi:hypothetical protein
MTGATPKRLRPAAQCTKEIQDKVRRAIDRWLVRRRIEKHKQKIISRRIATDFLLTKKDRDKIISSLPRIISSDDLLEVLKEAGLHIEATVINAEDVKGLFDRIERTIEKTCAQRMNIEMSCH